MKAPFLALIFALLATGCATQPLHSKTASGPAPSAHEHAASSPDLTAPRRVALPYAYLRHGVQIRVNSIEAAKNQVLVSATLQEARGQPADLLASTLLQVVPSTGTALDYVQYNRADKVQKEPTIHLEARDQFSITLIYQAAAGNSEASSNNLELRFPTGKYWNSSAAD